MISFTVRMTFASEDRAEAAEALRQLAVASRQEPGCVTYIPLHSEEDSETLMVFEQYRDEQALAAHSESKHFNQYAIGCLYQKMRSRQIENLVALA